MRSSSSTRVRQHHCQPGFVRVVHSMHSRQISRMSLRSRQMNEFDSLLQLLGLLQLEVCFPGPASASGTGLSCVPTCKMEAVCPHVPFRLTGVFLALAFLLAFPFLAPLTPFPSCLSLAHCPFGADVSGVVIGSLCQRPLSYVSTQSLVRLTICQGNHFQEITVGCWRVFHHSRHLGRLLEVCTSGNSVLCSFSQDASTSPRSRQSLCIFSHLARGLRIPLKSAAVRFPPLPSCSSLSSRHATNPKRPGTKDTRDRALPSHFVMSKA